MTDYNDYLDRHKYWESLSSENIRLLDEHLVLLASGALIFTISVVDILGPYYNFIWLNIIWALFAGSLLSRLFSFMCGEKNASKKIAILKKNMEEHQRGVKNYQHDSQNDSKFQSWTVHLNNLSFWLFIVGVIVFFVYAIMASQEKQIYINKRSLSTMQSQQSNETKPTFERYTLDGNYGTNQPISNPVNAPVATGTRGNPGTVAPLQRPIDGGTPLSPQPKK